MPTTPRTRYCITRNDPARTRRLKKIRAAIIDEANAKLGEDALASRLRCGRYELIEAAYGAGMPMEFCEECAARVVKPCVACAARAWRKKNAAEVKS